MKIVNLLMLIIITSCSTGLPRMKKDIENKEFEGKNYFFVGPFDFIEDISKDGEWSFDDKIIDISSLKKDYKFKNGEQYFDRCKSFKIHEVVDYWTTIILPERKVLIVEQNSNFFLIHPKTKLNFKLNAVLSNNFPFRNKKIHTTQKTFSTYEYLCTYGAQGVWTGMSLKELVFIANEWPTSINSHTNKNEQFQQVIYGNKYYYFRNDKLESWQEFN